MAAPPGSPTPPLLRYRPFHVHPAGTVNWRLKPCPSTSSYSYRPGASEPVRIGVAGARLPKVPGSSGVASGDGDAVGDGLPPPGPPTPGPASALKPTAAATTTRRGDSDADNLAQHRDPRRRPRPCGPRVGDPVAPERRQARRPRPSADHGGERLRERFVGDGAPRVVVEPRGEGGLELVVTVMRSTPGQVPAPGRRPRARRGAWPSPGSGATCRCPRGCRARGSVAVGEAEVVVHDEDRAVLGAQTAKAALELVPDRGRPLDVIGGRGLQRRDVDLHDATPAGATGLAVAGVDQERGGATPRTGPGRGRPARAATPTATRPAPRQARSRRREGSGAPFGRADRTRPSPAGQRPPVAVSRSEDEIVLHRDARCGRPPGRAIHNEP